MTERPGCDGDTDAAEYGPECVEVVRILPSEPSEAAYLPVPPESVLSALLRHDDVGGGHAGSPECRIDVLRPAVELQDDPLLGEPEVDPADEPGVVVERTLEYGPRSADLVEGDPSDRLPR